MSWRKPADARNLLNQQNRSHYLVYTHGNFEVYHVTYILWIRFRSQAGTKESACCWVEREREICMTWSRLEFDALLSLDQRQSFIGVTKIVWVWETHGRHYERVAPHPDLLSSEFIKGLALLLHPVFPVRQGGVFPPRLLCLYAVLILYWVGLCACRDGSDW